jgi:hypothetical protein
MQRQLSFQAIPAGWGSEFMSGLSTEENVHLRKEMFAFRRTCVKGSKKWRRQLLRPFQMHGWCAKRLTSGTKNERVSMS